MRRAPDWTARLAGAIAEGQGHVFTWGKWDCCAAAAALVSAQTVGAVDLTAPFTWTTRAGATRTMRRYLGAALNGDALLEATVTARLDEIGLPLVTPARAQRGDIVLGKAATPWGAGLALAAVDLTGAQALTAAAEGGWAAIPMAGWVKAWRL